ncbi:MAG: hypothetical protein V1934_00530, partial [Methanobacteriota archaeon]
ASRVCLTSSPIKQLPLVNQEEKERLSRLARRIMALYHKYYLDHGYSPVSLFCTDKGRFVASMLEYLVPLVDLKQGYDFTGRKLLDLGHGDGRVAYFLQQAFPEAKVTGVEFDKRLFDMSVDINLELAQLLSPGSVDLLRDDFLQEKHFTGHDIFYYYAAGTFHEEAILEHLCRYAPLRALFINYMFSDQEWSFLESLGMAYQEQFNRCFGPVFKAQFFTVYEKIALSSSPVVAPGEHLFVMRDESLSVETTYARYHAGYRRFVIQQVGRNKLVLSASIIKTRGALMTTRGAQWAARNLSSSPMQEQGSLSRVTVNNAFDRLLSRDINGQRIIYAVPDYLMASPFEKPVLIAFDILHAQESDAEGNYSVGIEGFCLNPGDEKRLLEKTANGRRPLIVLAFLNFKVGRIIQGL